MKKIFAVLVLLVAGILALWRYVTQPTPSERKSSVTEQPASALVVREGEKKLSTKSSYTSPAGMEDVGFDVVVDKEGVITGATVEAMTDNQISKMRQEAFGQALPQVIVGKKLQDLSHIDTIGGSSLTTGAFNEALTSLKSQL